MTFRAGAIITATIGLILAAVSALAVFSYIQAESNEADRVRSENALTRAICATNQVNTERIIDTKKLLQQANNTAKLNSFVLTTLVSELRRSSTTPSTEKNLKSALRKLRARRNVTRESTNRLDSGKIILERELENLDCRRLLR